MPEERTRPGPGQRARRVPLRRQIVPYAFLLPSGILFLLFGLIPIGAALVFSTLSGSVTIDPDFVGVGNYARLVSDPLFWEALRNTGVFTLGTVPVAMAGGLFLAVLLNRPLPGRAVFRTLLFAPMVASGVGVAVIMSWIFNGDYGVVNNALSAAGASRVPWLTSTTWAMPTVVLAVLWSRVGFCMVLYLAALQNIPESLREAAQLDGAGPWRRFRSVTWPLLAPTTFFLLIVNVVFSLQVFDLLFVLTGGGPGFATTVLIQFVYRAAFAQGNMGYASAAGVVLALILVLFTLLRFRASRKTEDVA
ncbi:sugar ABC transporter permease [Saccharopolyspora erythraea]|uniref:carbohydrate ABC transporter permease n=1 Tax=Saccharopolyspora erythraea TaxID=1836 RepID=UPI001BA602D9|nr:sugar ABC transporter permease [Saccharopolyspora erythraea]QUH01840.1 sugar ABC transporter permease [Saccharopolyspora erythraea]